MFCPKYQIRNRLLKTIREIGETLAIIKTRRLTAPAIAKLTLDARSLSSYASTSIEGNPLPLTDVKRLIKQSPKQIRDTEREVLNYNQALGWVQTQVKTGKFQLSAKTFAKVQGMVVDGLMDNPFDIGRLRQRAVVIRDPRDPNKTVFMPPDHGDVELLLDDLMKFVNANLNEIDPVLLAGIFHKQAVIIHPFMDGNGRSTRLMTTAILGMAGLDVFPIFAFESYYNRNVTKYFQMVGEFGDYYEEMVTGNDFTHWLEYFAEGILDELKRVQKSLPDLTGGPQLKPHEKLILDYIDQHSSITQREYETLTDRSRSMRIRDLKHMVASGLTKKHGGGRSVFYTRGNQTT